ncbi:hypothetical protein [Hyalangium gracile]|uniref:hypothetical protein n=1 Tax=Hyalangium gracile TaxID=394092 RepID=UPI001CCF18DF|nr:hypothetical protein [Hyalangium gracile]
MAIAEVHVRIGKLLAAIDELLETSSTDIRLIERVVDLARWSKLYIDLELAYKPYRDVRDAEWTTRKFTTEESARKLLVEFRDTLRDVEASTTGHVEQRNLRARVEGVLNVTQEWWKQSAEKKQGSATGAGGTRPA